MAVPLENEKKKLNICLTHYLVGFTDGVSLEMDKHKKVFEDMGHTVTYLGGAVPDESKAGAFVIPEMDHRCDLAVKVYHNGYEKLDDFKDGAEFAAFINENANALEKKLVDFFEKHAIDLIICHNMLSHAVHPVLSVAMTTAIEKCNISRAIGYHHDFYWERPVFDKPTCAEIVAISDKYIPPLDTKVYKHCTINSIGAASLLQKKKLESVTIPNVFDYENGEEWRLDDYNRTLYDALGIDMNGDLVVLQATRIMKRKGIELAIEVVRRMVQMSPAFVGQTMYNGKKFTGKLHFVFPGLDQEPDREYVKFLDAQLSECGAKVHKINSMIGHIRVQRDQKKQYSLWDSYVISDLVTYPSIQEGWGNQYLEAIFAKKPQLLFEYPVYTTDIKSLGFRDIELGKNYSVSTEKSTGVEFVTVDPTIIEQAAKECMRVLFDQKEYRAMVEHNFEIAKKHLSYTALQKLWEQIFAKYD
eukprot:CAMPEP_0202694544 /NCGR_PEP_ID=MMETSP1385-20130828/8379_1 /ASSEMBLY_ACC=CAM_ASM_000861 /TAXON_ID=933848 /ORGANISM="Elphidium margaritaceum" /LENGTH=471 /DNA_ID=CAMNT_0049350413 /DNA_START=42 /DNA_END=1457 /DNA_ORIENTATION=+